MRKGTKKISRELNDILIERIRKYQSQDVTQLLNNPIDEDSNNSYLGGLINFVGDDSNNLDEEINNFLDKISIDEIHIESLPDNEYNEDEEENNNNINYIIIILLLFYYFNTIKIFIIFFLIFIIFIIR